MHGEPGYHGAVSTGAPQRQRRPAWWALLLTATMLLSASLGCAHLRGGGSPQGWHYAVKPSAKLDRLDVELCFRDQLPPELVADEDGAADYLLSATAGGRALTIDREAGTITTNGVRGKCMRYAVDLARMVDEVVERHMVRVGGIVATSPHLWLWRPTKLYQEAEVTLGFDLPGQVAASVSWPRIPGKTADEIRQPRFRLPTTAFHWASQVVLGDFHALRFTAAGTEFEVAVMDLPREISDEGLRQWLTVAATTVASLYDGRFPVPHMQVIVVPYPGGGDPVYFGMALRGGGPAVQLLVSSEATDDQFPGEWVAIHEFLHHGMPFIDGAWLSEGFVTYYTAVLRTRAGFQDERAAWAGLIAGFGRGARSGTGQSLADESRTMHENAAYQRVYWGGAAIALMADVALRSADSSLDAAMRHVQRCCAHTQRIWPAEQVLQAMDEMPPAPGPRPANVAGPRRPSLMTLSGPILRSVGFPELLAIYRKLGVVVVNGDPTLDESASLAPIRRAIFTQFPP